ncbi:hypothetical protein GNP84_16035 [Aliivibrio fischeri]|uniref:hypothetical protein n=1 Tax=Aliivibrio fischeri TaxID=668 RepID=UPI0012D8BBAE|nr:hypothetical protein [Aliivibrio fischeri]MUK78397.1 hypothetical protein [Aliivibrio fischeri]
MADIFVWLGVVVFLVGGALLVLEAFSQNIVWGMLCIIFNPIAIVFCSMYWKDAKYPFAIQITGLVITLLSLSLQSNY